MACTIVEITSVDCIASDGGLKYTFIADTAALDAAIAHTAYVISTAMALTTGTWAIFEYDTDDDTSYYNQEGERNNNRHVYNQTAFMKFAGVTSTKRAAAEALKDCCALVAVHFANNGKSFVQGIELGASPAWDVTKKKCKATVNIMTDTGANEDRVEITLISQSRQASPMTTLTKADFIAP